MKKIIKIFKKEFIRAFEYVTLFQFGCWACFTLVDETTLYNRELIAFVIGIILLIGIIVLYFYKIKETIQKYQLNSKVFHWIIIILWILYSVLITIGLLQLVSMKILHICTDTGFFACFLNGFEYFMYGFAMIVMAIILLLIKLGIIVYQKIYTCNKQIKLEERV